MGLSKNFDDLLVQGVLISDGNTLRFNETFRSQVLEYSSTLDDIKCRGSQCETREAIREAIDTIMRNRDIHDNATISLCAELFILEHGKTSVELES